MERILAEIRVRADTWDNWITKNPILGKNEPATVLDGLNKGKLKIGDGVTLWNDLEFAVGQTGAAGKDGAPGTPGKDGAPGTPGSGVGTIGWDGWTGVPAVGNYILAMGLVSNSIPPSFMLGTLVNICVAARPECCRNGAPLTQDYFIYDSNNRNYFYLGPQGGYVIVGTVPGTYRFLGRTNFDMGNYIYANNQTANLLQRVA